MIPLALIAAAFLAQEAPSAAVPTLSVSGKVLNSANGEGISKAIVILRNVDSTNGASYAEETDGAGHFQVNDIEPGSYFITANHPSYFLPPQGAPGSPPPRTKIESGQQLKDVNLRLLPLGVITGRVTDQDGDPVRAEVQLMQYGYQNGKKEFRTTGMARTTEKGDFRLFGLRPGTYYLQASKIDYMSASMERNVRGPKPQTSMGTTFFPNAADAAHAVPLQLEAGAQLRGIDFRVRPDSVHIIRFKLPDGERFSGLAPMLMSADNNMFVGSTTRVGPGYIDFGGLLSGSYIVLVTRTAEGRQMFARRQVDVANDDVDAGTLNFVPAMDVSGTVRIEGAATTPVQSLRVTLQPIGPSQTRPEAEVKPDGTFTVRGVQPNSYRVMLANGPGKLYVKSIRIGDQDLADRRIDLTGTAPDPISILLASDVGTIDGSVQHAGGEPAARVRVTAIPYGDHIGRGELQKFAFTDDQGHFSIKNVAPGEYKVFAWEDVEIGAPQDPEFRKPFEKLAASVKLSSNGNQTVQLTAIVTKSPDQ